MVKILETNKPTVMQIRIKSIPLIEEALTIIPLIKPNMISIITCIRYEFLQPQKTL